MVSDAALIFAGLVAGLLLLWLVLRLVNRGELLAEVNERSSHAVPTPTMGGVVIVVVVLSYLAYRLTDLHNLGWGVLIATSAVAAIGLWDDLSQIGAKIRFVVHLLAAALGLWGLGIEPGLAGLVLLVGLVWFTNLFNFMDGIDGFAAVQTLVFCMGVQIITTGTPGWVGDMLWLLSGVTVAFLAYNWAPARIFMGDVGSGFLGLLIGLLVLYLWQTAMLPLIGSLILLAGFWFDASYTLCVRIVTGQPFTQAHRSHLYQRLAQRKGHAWTTGVFILFATLWLIPLAWTTVHVAALEGPLWQFLMLVLAVLPLAIGCWRLRAGSKVDV